MNLYEHAKSELDLIYSKESLKEKDGINKMMYNGILQLIKTFSKQGHSGASAYYCLDIFNKLAHFKVLTEITNNPDEWMEVDILGYQSRRESSCFSTDLKYYYNIDDKKMPKWKRLFTKNDHGLKLKKLKEYNGNTK